MIGHIPWAAFKIFAKTKQLLVMIFASWHFQQGESPIKAIREGSLTTPGWWTAEWRLPVWAGGGEGATCSVCLHQVVRYHVSCFDLWRYNLIHLHLTFCISKDLYALGLKMAVADYLKTIRCQSCMWVFGMVFFVLWNWLRLFFNEGLAVSKTSKYFK